MRSMLGLLALGTLLGVLLGNLIGALGLCRAAAREPEPSEPEPLERDWPIAPPPIPTSDPKEKTHMDTATSSENTQGLRRRLLGTRKRKLLAGMVVLALAIAAAALAAWLVNSTNGSGRGQVATLVAPTIAEGGAGTSGPGDASPGSDGDLVVKVTNSNAVPLTVTGFSDDGTGTLTSTNPATCPVSNFTLNSGTTAAPTTVPANSVGFVMRLKNAFHLAAAAPSACQGTEFLADQRLTVNWST